ncbi:MAG TPA: hypothetical protein VHS78_00655 [Candidatus Elarobacter sp.]|jgi:hypothetical protein|nr:hypothetical protein [Candidatus Elarobacter sp.]
MNRGSFLVAASCALAASSPAATLARRPGIADPELGQWGAEIGTLDRSGVLAALSPRALQGTVLGTSPAAENANAFILTNLPSIATQGVPGHVGSPGSCEAQSFGYCLGAYTAARTPNGSPKWSAADPANQPSAAWLYQWEHRVVEHDKRICPKGSGAKAYLDRLVADGAPSSAQVPYDPHDYPTVPAECAYIKDLDVARVWPGEARLTIGSYKVFSGIANGKSTYLPQFKELIRHGHAIAFTGLVAKQYGVAAPQLTNGVWTAPNGFITKSGHGQVIVGFDDAKGPHGAFLVQNSFGPGWNAGPASDHGRNGRIWWDYDAFFASQKYAAIAYPAPPPSLTLPPGAAVLQADDPGAPQFAVANAVPYSEGGAHHLVLVTHASDAITLTELRVRGPAGRVYTAKLNESTRLGYQYVHRGGRPFVPGTYGVTYTARTRSGRTVTYRGSVRVA